VPVYLETNELAAALGIAARPNDDTDTIEIRTGLHGNTDRVVGADLSLDAVVLDEPDLKTSVAPAALISAHDLQLIRATPVDVGLLISTGGDDEVLTQVIDYTDRNTLYSEQRTNEKRSIETWALLVICPLLLGVNSVIVLVVIRSGLRHRVLFWQLGAASSVAKKVVALKLAILIGAAVSAGSVMSLAAPLALRCEGATLSVPFESLIVILAVSAASVAFGVLAVEWAHHYRGDRSSSRGGREA